MKAEITNITRLIEYIDDNLLVLDNLVKSTYEEEVEQCKRKKKNNALDTIKWAARAYRRSFCHWRKRSFGEIRRELREFIEHNNRGYSAWNTYPRSHNMRELYTACRDIRDKLVIADINGNAVSLSDDDLTILANFERTVFEYEKN